MNKNNLYIIYCHKNKINGKRYIGQTKQNLKRRFGSGCHYSKSTYFYNAIQKYGWENFEHIILEENLTEDEVDAKECYWISYYHTWVNDPQCWGYNLESGGNKNKHLSEETKEKMKGNQNGKNNKGKTFKTRKIICIETNTIYNNVKEAAIKIDRTIESLYRALNNPTVRCNKCHWKWIDKEA